MPRNRHKQRAGQSAPSAAGPRRYEHAHRCTLVLGLVILWRILNAHYISRAEFEQAYADKVAQFVERPRASGGDFYLTQAVRLSRRFARAVIANTLEGHTLFRDAYQMLGVNKEQTFFKLGKSLDVLP